MYIVHCINSTLGPSDIDSSLRVGRLCFSDVASPLKSMSLVVRKGECTVRPCPLSAFVFFLVSVCARRSSGHYERTKGSARVVFDCP